MEFLQSYLEINCNFCALRQQNCQFQIRKKEALIKSIKEPFFPNAATNFSNNFKSTQVEILLCFFSCTVKLRFSSSQKGRETFYVSSTVWKSRNSSVSKILREINLDRFRASITTIFGKLKGSKCSKIDFTQNLRGRKFVDFHTVCNIVCCLRKILLLRLMLTKLILL